MRLSVSLPKRDEIAEVHQFLFLNSYTMSPEKGRVGSEASKGLAAEEKHDRPGDRHEDGDGDQHHAHERAALFKKRVEEVSGTEDPNTRSEGHGEGDLEAVGFVRIWSRERR